MNSMRVDQHPVLGNMGQRQKLKFVFEGKQFTAYKGDTIASALLASGVRTLRRHEDKGTPKGIYCNIGHCFECRVRVNGQNSVRACLTPVENNMIIESNVSRTMTSRGGKV
ncbi:(2Fe-2S)-binding protein [Niallia oryzisoli]|uniref:(2Fe-2S)-binding protein n=1 Tax=Niallia oryzisoli TaxID=1737571 RepID=UPI0037356F72